VGERTRVGDGTHWEALAGYSRAVRHGRRILVSGTTGHVDDGAELGGTADQTRRALERGLAAVTRLGGRREDVVRSRVYLVPGADWEEAARVHGELLGDVAPANTLLFVHALVGDGLLVEVELDAELDAELADEAVDGAH
jgi:enamine deaminase RidA (YjgF/YER057c/UK114 family)